MVTVGIFALTKRRKNTRMDDLQSFCSVLLHFKNS
ncbi:hypothetical protein P869_08395 [Ligilactobacillus ruminis S23]|nr:hypothetical protein P869_08395 [Ligilactobacillus ruminis S23]